MASKKLAYFDVRRRQRHDNNGNRQEVPREMSINLMCFLLRGIMYKNIYVEDLVPRAREHLFDKLIINARNLPEDLKVDAQGDAYPDIIEEFTKPDETGAFDRVKKIIDDYNAPGPTVLLNLGYLLQNARVDPPVTDIDKARNDMVDILDSISFNNPRMNHFCAPFVGIQKGRAALVHKDDYDDFIKHFQTWNIEQFYKRNGPTAKKVAAARAMKAGILSETKPHAWAGGEGNGLHCVDGECCSSNSADDWCEEVYEGGSWGCSLGSDTGTQCYPVTSSAKKKRAPKKASRRVHKSSKK